MGKAEDEVLWRAVRANRRGILATIGEDGMPHLTNVHYLADGSSRVVRITTTTDRVKGRNLLRDPRAALHVQDDDWFAFAVAQGTVTTAEAREVGDAAIDDLHVIFSAFRGPQQRPAFDDQMIAKRRMVVRLDVERLYGLVPAPSTRTGAA